VFRSRGVKVDNSVKRAAATGQWVQGVHLTFAAPTIIEVLAAVPVDFVYIDGEHGAFGIRDVEGCCIAAERHSITPIARVPDRSAATITRFLDRGVLGIVVPHVDSVADAKEVLEAAYYAPAGSRSFGAGRPQFGMGIGDKPAHFRETNETISVCIMIESLGALEAAGEIAALPGVDYMNFGLHDLAQALGHPGEPAHPEVAEAARRASDQVRAAGKRIREDFMRFAWVNEILVSGARHLLAPARH
jgi:4-hydroxy-2-oxoheptanedioate aldolase